MRSIRNVKVAVIGGAGFLGSHLVEHLIRDRGCRVTVIDNLCAGRREFVPPEAEFIHHDICFSEEFLHKLFLERGISYVFNYAAWPYVPDSFTRPKRVMDVNLMGAIGVINAAHEAGCLGVLQVSSAELYGNGVLQDCEVKDAWRGGKLDESAMVRPHSTYGAAKAAVDYYCQCAWRERRTPVIALRQFNCVGERETHPYVIPEIISQLARAKESIDEGPSILEGATPIVRLGNDSARDFMYAGDAVRIAVELLERGSFGEVYNLGSEQSIGIYDLARLIGKLMGFAEVEVVQDKERCRPWEIWSLCADNSKIMSAIGRERFLSATSELGLVQLEEALHRTIRWFEENGRRWPWER